MMRVGRKQHAPTLIDSSLTAGPVYSPTSEDDQFHAFPQTHYAYGDNGGLESLPGAAAAGRGRWGQFTGQPPPQNHQAQLRKLSVDSRGDLTSLDGYDSASESRSITSEPTLPGAQWQRARGIDLNAPGLASRAPGDQLQSFPAEANLQGRSRAVSYSSIASSNIVWNMPGVEGTPAGLLQLRA
jgi:hypothetical protein